MSQPVPDTRGLLAIFFFCATVAPAAAADSAAVVDANKLIPLAIRFDPGISELTLRVDPPATGKPALRHFKTLPIVPPGASLVLSEKGNRKKQQVAVWYNPCNPEARDIDGAGGCQYLVPANEPAVFRLWGVDPEQLRVLRAELQRPGATPLMITLGDIEPDGSCAIEIPLEQASDSVESRLVLLPPLPPPVTTAKNEPTAKPQAPATVTPAPSDAE
jgi:hypothetical protein